MYKDGPNKGREFYGCLKPREQGCGFFLWADDTPSSSRVTDTSGRRGRGRGVANRGGANTSRGGGGGGTKRRCGNCREEGK